MYLIRVVLVVGSALPVAAQYAGPAILTRGEAPTAMRGAPISFRPFIDFRAIYDTGLTGVGVADQEGNLASSESAGIEMTAGVSGSHAWRHTQLGLDYRGSIRHYTQKTFFDGTDHAINLGVSHQLSRRMSFTIRESAGVFSRDFGLINLQQSVPFDPGGSYIPNTDFFDNRTLYFSSQADFTYLRTARLSFNAGGDVFTAKRRSQALYGITGASARGDVQYRVARYTTLGVNYFYSRFDFSKSFGGTDLHGVVGTYAVRLTRTVEFSSYAGLFRAETKFVSTVDIDPVIAAIIGRQRGEVVNYRVDRSPTIGLRLSKAMKGAVAGITASRAVTPGNGLFLTSVTNDVGVQYTYNGARYWSFGASAGYSNAKAISNVVGNYNSWNSTMTMSRRIAASTSLVAELGARKYDSSDFGRYNRWIYRATIGIGFSPGDMPLRVW